MYETNIQKIENTTDLAYFIYHVQMLKTFYLVFNIMTHLFSFSDQFSGGSLQQHLQAGAASCMQVKMLI